MYIDNKQKAGSSAPHHDIGLDILLHPSLYPLEAALCDKVAAKVPAPHHLSCLGEVSPIPPEENTKQTACKPSIDIIIYYYKPLFQ